MTYTPADLAEAQTIVQKFRQSGSVMFCLQNEIAAALAARSERHYIDLCRIRDNSYGSMDRLDGTTLDGVRQMCKELIAELTDGPTEENR